MEHELIVNYARFKKVAKMLSRSLDIPHMDAMEKLSKVFGYRNFQELAHSAGPNEPAKEGKSQLTEQRLMDQLVQFFGPSCESLEPQLDAELMRLARLHARS